MRHVVTLLAGLVGWGVLSYFTVWGSLPGWASGVSGLAPRIQADLQSAADRAVGDLGFDWARVRVDGQVAILEGEAPREDERAVAKAAVLSSTGKGGFWRGGILFVRDETTLAPAASPFQWRAAISSGRLVLEGAVPSREVRAALFEYASSLFPLEIENRMEVRRGAPSEAEWAAVARAALAQLASIEGEYALLKDTDLLIVGAAPDAQSHARVAEAVARLPLPFAGSTRIARPAGEPVVNGVVPMPSEAGAPTPITAPSACQDVFDRLTDGADVVFESGRTEIDKESYPLLDRLAVAAGRCAGLRIFVEGHTDNLGDPGSNLRLSQRRAQAVADYLVLKGVEVDRVAARGFGDARPIADNATENGRADNRRIEFVVEG